MSEPIEQSSNRIEMPDEDVFLFELADFFKVLGDTTRIRIICALSTGELCVQDLEKRLNMSQSAISHQLHALKQARLVRYRKVGKNAFYVLDDEHVATLFSLAREHMEERTQR